jgi:hypothetical protein
MRYGMPYIMSEPRSIFSAAESGLGFIYQPRLALLRLLSLPESTSLLIEKSDDLEFDTASGRKTLASLKHKAEGDSLTDLDLDFWKSLRVWLAYYVDNGRISSTLTSFCSLRRSSRQDQSLRCLRRSTAIRRIEPRWPQRFWIAAPRRRSARPRRIWPS